jgi:hypothetical protein
MVTPGGGYNVVANSTTIYYQVNPVSYLSKIPATYSTDISLNGNLVVGGKATAVSFNATSDYRVKADVQVLDGAYVVDRLRPVSYTNTLSNQKDIGFLAHEVQEEFPFLVTGEKDAEVYQSLNYIGLIGVLVKEMKDMKAEMVTLKAKVDRLP